MKSQSSWEIQWTDTEIIPKEDEVFSFPHQLPPLDFRYPESECARYDLLPSQQDYLDAPYMMDIISADPISSSTDILPDPTPYEDGFVVGGDGELGFSDQKMSMMNSFGFQNQEMHMTNCFHQSQNAPAGVMAPKDAGDKEEMKMVRPGNQKPTEQKGENGNCGFNHPSRLTLSREMISQYFYLPITKAAKKLNVGLTLLKKRCRELGIRRWPHRKLMSLQTLINNVQELGKSSGDGAEEKLQEAVTLLEKERKKMEELPDSQLQDNTKRLRQACFKANYKKRKTMGTNSSTLRRSSSLCSATSVDYGGYDVMEDGEEEEEIKSILFTDYFTSSSNAFL